MDELREVILKGIEKRIQTEENLLDKLDMLILKAKVLATQP